MKFEYYIVLMIISYIIILIAVFIIELNERKNSRNVRKEIINIIREISNLYIDLNKEVNVHSRQILVGQIFDLYKEILLMIDSNKNENIVKGLIEDELHYCYREYYKDYVNAFKNEERYVIINHYVLKWKRSAITK